MLRRARGADAAEIDALVVNLLPKFKASKLSAAEFFESLGLNLENEAAVIRALERAAVQGPPQLGPTPMTFVRRSVADVDFADKDREPAALKRAASFAIPTSNSAVALAVMRSVQKAREAAQRAGVGDALTRAQAQAAEKWATHEDATVRAAALALLGRQQ